MTKVTNKKKESKVKRFFSGLAEKIDKKMEEKARNNRCCCSSDNDKNNSCCS